MKYEPVIGLEIHAELKTKTKMFCDSLNDPDEKHPNINVCPVCMGHPGTLPVINRRAVELVLKVGIALGSTIPKHSKFDRKNYFYPDLPKGYQISQYDKPFCEGGQIFIGDKNINITRIHLEEDAGRLVHPEGENFSLIDFNRAGVPLMELVTEPEIRSSAEAKKFAQELQLILRYLEASDANMEKGQMRVEANISLRSEGEIEFGTKVEVKNLNSFRVVKKAIDYEIGRQTKVLEIGEKVIQETRGWDEKKQVTFSQRAKEDAHEYRYFPEPDLPPLVLTKEAENGFDLEILRADIIELPRGRRERFKKEYGIKDEDIALFVADKALGEYYEKVVSELGAWEKAEGEKPDPKELARLSANYITSDLQNLLRSKGAGANDLLITPENFAELIKMIHLKEISSRGAKDVLAEMFSTGKDPSQIVKDKGLKQVSDESEIEKIVGQILKENPKAVEDYKKGKDESIKFLIGQVMKETKGSANPEMARAVILGLIVK